MTRPWERDRDGIYCTTFCNHAHRLSDGLPVNHECFELDPARLRAEMRGEEEAFETPLPKEPRRVHPGVRK